MNQLYFPFFTNIEPIKDVDQYPGSAPALQSALCGLLCMDSQANRTTWYKGLFEDLCPNRDEIIKLTALFDQTVKELNSINFNFKLKLPNDDEPLSSRIIAISDWCKGLIFGLDISRLIKGTEISQNCQEYIKDIVQISQISNINVQDNNDTDTNLENIAEYLRIGLFLLYEELQPLSLQKK
ncbi:MAG: UPF0149 family protein [Piscirickettsiaceae bacterium]|nr:UPF0149 family protein [Piscirickettsiaceae bacterium]